MHFKVNNDYISLPSTIRSSTQLCHSRKVLLFCLNMCGSTSINFCANEHCTNRIKSEEESFIFRLFFQTIRNVISWVVFEHISLKLVERFWRRAKERGKNNPSMFLSFRLFRQKDYLNRFESLFNWVSDKHMWSFSTPQTAVSALEVSQSHWINWNHQVPCKSFDLFPANPYGIIRPTSFTRTRPSHMSDLIKQ